VRRWYVEPAIGYVAALACMLLSSWRLHDLVWGFWITSLSVCYALLLAFLGILYGWMRTQPGFQGPHRHTLPAFLLVAIPIFGAALVAPFLAFGDEAIALHKRYPLPITNTDPGTLIPYLLKQYWPLVLTVIGSHWRVLQRQGSEEERIVLPLAMALAMLALLQFLTGMLVVVGWMLRTLGIPGAEMLLAGIVILFAYLPLETALRQGFRKLRAAHEEHLRRNPPRISR
jgi:hypothetical protein